MNQHYFKCDDSFAFAFLDLVRKFKNFCTTSVPNSTYLFDRNLKGFRFPSNDDETVALIFLVSVLLKEENDPLGWLLYLQIEKHDIVRIFQYSEFQNLNTVSLIYNMVNFWKKWNHPRKIFSLYDEKYQRKFRLTFRIIFERHPRPKEKRRIGVGYRDKGSRREIHEHHDFSETTNEMNLILKKRSAHNDYVHLLRGFLE